MPLTSFFVDLTAIRKSNSCITQFSWEIAICWTSLFFERAKTQEYPNLSRADAWAGLSGAKESVPSFLLQAMGVWAQYAG